MKYTFDQGHIQDDLTGEFLKSVEVKARCIAFPKDGLKEYRLQIGADKTVRVWDAVAGHFTTCHSLSPKTQRGIIRRFIRA